MNTRRARSASGFVMLFCQAKQKRLRKRAVRIHFRRKGLKNQGLAL
jgi:hypothetical protein